MAIIEKKSPELLDDRYWARLQSLGKPFHLRQGLWVHALEGWAPRLGMPAIAIVGTRRPTSYGLRFVAQFLSALAATQPRNPPVIISGGALGIDAWAHECALRERLQTESWVVGPVRAPNPRVNRPLFESLVARGGAVLCPESLEPRPGRTPYKSDWVQRNAYLVARADVVLVPEANELSGTWSSVRWANKMGIPVFALPGPVDRGSSQGTNLMISSGYAHPIGGATKLIQDLVVEGVLDSYNRGRDEELALTVWPQAIEERLCSPGGIQVVDLPGLSARLGLKLESLCEYLVDEVHKGKLHRVGNGFERRG